MYTKVCEDLGIEVPLFAFSHCRDVVVEVSKAGGLGVLGAGFMDAQQLREELNRIDEHIGDKPYSVDVVIPQNYVGKGEGELTEEELEAKLGDDYIHATGKGARVLRNEWTNAWDNADNPNPLEMPLHGLVTADAMRRTETYAGAGDTQKVAMNICGQVIGQINEVESCRGVVFRLINEYLEALEKVNALMPE